MRSEAVDAYIRSFPDETKQRLEVIRSLVQELAPEAQEKISYAIPTFTLSGKNLIHFAGYKNHIGLYPGPALISKFASDLSGYKTSKGTVQFPLNKPLPIDLIRKIIKSSLKTSTVPRDLSQKN